MELSFSSTKLMKMLETEKEMKKCYSPEIARKIILAMHDLRSAPSLLHIGLTARWRLHELQWGMKGCFSMDLNARIRLIIRPDKGGSCSKDGFPPLDRITKVIIEEITDTHDGKVRRK